MFLIHLAAGMDCCYVCADGTGQVLIFQRGAGLQRADGIECFYGVTMFKIKLSDVHSACNIFIAVQ